MSLPASYLDKKFITKAEADDLEKLANRLREKAVNGDMLEGSNAILRLLDIVSPK